MLPKWIIFMPSVTRKKYKMARCLCKTMNALLAAGHFDWHTIFGERCTL